MYHHTYMYVLYTTIITHVQLSGVLQSPEDFSSSEELFDVVGGMILEAGEGAGWKGMVDGGLLVKVLYTCSTRTLEQQELVLED